MPGGRRSLGGTRSGTPPISDCSGRIPTRCINSAENPAATPSLRESSVRNRWERWLKETTTVILQPSFEHAKGPGMKPALLELLDLCIASSPAATIPKEIHISRAPAAACGIYTPESVV